MLSYLSPTQIGVRPLGAWAEDGANNVSEATPQTVDLATPGVPLGTDAYVSPGTVAVTLGSPLIAGTGTAFTTGFGFKLVSTEVVFTNGSSTFTDASGNAQWLDGPRPQNLKAGDLVGHPLVGWYAVASVEANGSGTLTAPFPAATSTLPAVAIEQPTVEVGTVPPQTVRVVTIVDDVTAYADQPFPANAAGAVATIGAPLVGPTTSEDLWLHVWACRGPAGTTVIASGQRTFPLVGAAGLAGYLVDVRRLGAVLSTVGPVLYQWTDHGSFQRREVQWEAPSGAPFAPVAGTGNLVSGGGTWVRLDLRTVIPPTAKLAILGRELRNPAGTVSLATRPHGAGSATVTRPDHVRAPAGATVRDRPYQITDGAQVIDWGTDVADVNNPVYLDAAGFVEELGP